ncbi:hypothetical protein TYRP_021017 [Tyrophagus putrescentiae]|nr:hypothetical protein TYRP_021017 [Tyrophagus putrescentiae]
MESPCTSAAKPLFGLVDWKSMIAHAFTKHMDVHYEAHQGTMGQIAIIQMWKVKQWSRKVKMKKGRTALRTKLMLMVLLVVNLLAEPGTPYQWESVEDATGKGLIEAVLVVLERNYPYRNALLDFAKHDCNAEINDPHRRRNVPEGPRAALIEQQL